MSSSMDRALRQYIEAESESVHSQTSSSHAPNAAAKQTPCTYAGHQQATSTYEEFLAATANHRPWQEPDREIDIVLGDCTHCNSTLGWSRRPLSNGGKGQADGVSMQDRGDTNNSKSTSKPRGLPENHAKAAIERPTLDMPSKSLSRFLIEEAVISHEQLVKTRSSQTGSLSDALVETGALTAQELAPFLRAYERGGQGATEFVSALLCNRPRSKVLEIITNQLMRSLTNTVGVRVTADGCHSNVEDLAPCDYTISQSFIGDFEGEVYLNISSSLMLQIASTFVAKKATSVRTLVEDGVCDFLNTVNSNACVQLSSLGTQVALLRPRLYRHAQWGERAAAPFDLSKRVAGSTFTAIRWAHPGGRHELCIVDGTGRE